MTITVMEILPHEWMDIAESAHMTCFGEKRPNSLNSYHFVLGAFCNKDLAGYMTCLEQDKETVYIQHGGAFPNYAKSIYVLSGYRKMIHYLKEKYKQVWTRIENANSAMIKLALKLGFKIVGTFTQKDKLYLELFNDFGR